MITRKPSYVRCRSGERANATGTTLGVQAEITPDHPGWELSVVAVTWAGGRKPFGDLERRVSTRAAQVFKRKPPPALSEDLTKRVATAKQQIEEVGVKVR